MRKRTIYFIDDIPGHALNLIRRCIVFYQSKRKMDIAVCLIAVVPELDIEDTKKECSDFGKQMNKPRSKVFSSSIISYTSTIDSFSGSTEKLAEKIFAKIKKEPYSVAIDLMLFDRADVRKIDSDIANTKILSHYLAKKYSGRCSLYSSLQEIDTTADYHKWNKMLGEDEKVCAEFHNIYNFTEGDIEGLAEELYYLAK